MTIPVISAVGKDFPVSVEQFGFTYVDVGNNANEIDSSIHTDPERHLAQFLS